MDYGGDSKVLQKCLQPYQHIFMSYHHQSSPVWFSVFFWLHRPDLQTLIPYNGFLKIRCLASSWVLWGASTQGALCKMQRITLERRKSHRAKAEHGCTCKMLAPGLTGILDFKCHTCTLKDYESIYRLVLITHEMLGCDGASAIKHQFWYPGSCPTLHPNLFLFHFHPSPLSHSLYI